MMAFASNCLALRLVVQPSSVSLGSINNWPCASMLRSAQRPLDAFDVQRLFPQRHALALTGMLPDRGGIGLEPLGQRRHVGGARVPLDQPVQLRQA